MSAKLQIDPDYRSTLHFNSGMIKVAFVRVKYTYDIYERAKRRSISLYTLHIRACPPVRCWHTYLAIDLSRCRRVAINRKSRNNEAVDCRAPAVYIDVCVGSDDVMRVETREGEKAGTGESDGGKRSYVVIEWRKNDGFTDLGMYDVGQSDPVPAIL